ncbi:hypothetical protein HPB50_017709 [Hyalomma asiaticum]|uniref:Uncharacterized protein n=1 Tax=Hyalomma asiaticum TaxID=266040 RepID=A0ACB7SG85_HYAAI|nr:hypothetical protein HPB50_017709 [Hyalomma asiaticum]
MAKAADYALRLNIDDFKASEGWLHRFRERHEIVFRHRVWRRQRVIQALIALVNDPEPEHPLRADLAEEYSKDRKKFLKNAEDFTKKHSEKRPPD